MKEFEEAIKEVNNYLGIDPSAILNNANSTEEQKMRDLFKMTLTASLQKQQENMLYEQDFNIEEFVESQCELLGVGNINFIPPMLLTRDKINRLKNLKDDAIKTELINLYSEVMAIVYQSTAEKIGTILANAGILALSIAGMAISILAFSTGAIPAAIAGVVVSGIGIVTSIGSLIYTIFNFSDRSLYGLIINDSQYDMCIEGEYVNVGKSGGATTGIFLKHGNLKTIFCDHKAKATPFINGIPTDDRLGVGAAVGLFMFAKSEGFFGSEGIIRINAKKPEHQAISLMAACPMQADNRMMISFNYSGDKNYVAYDHMYAAMKNIKDQSENRGGLTVKSTINDSRNSPAYGIISITQK